MDNCAEIECPFNGVTKSGRVWRKVPESDAGSAVSAVVSLAQGSAAHHGPRAVRVQESSGAPETEELLQKTQFINTIKLQVYGHSCNAEDAKRRLVNK